MTGSLQVKNDKYYAVLNFRDNDGKRVQKWIPLNLPLRGNKRKAETMLRQLIEQYQGLEAIEPIKHQWGNHPTLRQLSFYQPCCCPPYSRGQSSHLFSIIILLISHKIG